MSWHSHSREPFATVAAAASRKKEKKGKNANYSLFYYDPSIFINTFDSFAYTYIYCARGNAFDWALNASNCNDFLFYIFCSMESIESILLAHNYKWWKIVGLLIFIGFQNADSDSVAMKIDDLTATGGRCDFESVEHGAFVVSKTNRSSIFQNSSVISKYQKQPENAVPRPSVSPTCGPQLHNYVILLLFSFFDVNIDSWGMPFFCVRD